MMLRFKIASNQCQLVYHSCNDILGLALTHNDNLIRFVALSTFLFYSILFLHAYLEVLYMLPPAVCWN